MESRWLCGRRFAKGSLRARDERDIDFEYAARVYILRPCLLGHQAKLPERYLARRFPDFPGNPHVKLRAHKIYFR